jgi:hypothetical protein
MIVIRKVVNVFNITTLLSVYMENNCRTYQYNRYIIAAKLQFLVDAKGVDCPAICEKVSSSSHYKEGLKYDNKGVAVCYC